MCRKKETAYRFPLSTDSENRSRCAAGSKRPATRNGGEAYWQLLYSPPLTHIYRNWRSPSTFCYIASYPTCFLFLCSCFFLCLLCRLLIKEFTSMSTSTAPLISFLLFERLKRRETYRRSPFVFVVSFVTRSLIPYGYIYTLDSLVYLVLYYPGWLFRQPTQSWRLISIDHNELILDMVHSNVQFTYPDIYQDVDFWWYGQAAQKWWNHQLIIPPLSNV